MVFDNLLNSLTSYATVHEQRDFSRSSIFRLLSDAYVYILGGPEYLDAELLNKAQRLRIIVVLGTGISTEAVNNALRHGLIKPFFIDGYYGRNVPDFLYWDDPEKLIDLPGFTATSHIAVLEESCILSFLSEAFKKVPLFLEGN